MSVHDRTIYSIINGILWQRIRSPIYNQDKRLDYFRIKYVSTKLKYKIYKNTSMGTTIYYNSPKKIT